MVHKLNVCSSFFLVRQKKKVFAQDRVKVIAEEVRKLLEANFIREVYYLEWLANVVMVKKANGKRGIDERIFEHGQKKGEWGALGQVCANPKKRE